MTESASDCTIIDAAGLDALIRALAGTGHQVLGPVRRDGAILYEPVAAAADLPRGWLDEQDGGRYRLRQEGDAYFGFTVGPSSWKRFLHPPEQRLWRSEVENGVPAIRPEPVATPRYAFLGVRSCELAAIAVQDKVFLDGPYRDPHYAARREGLFIVAVNCGRATSTCFCASMATGPRAKAGYDIALTEIAGGTFVAEAGSARGAALLAELDRATGQRRRSGGFAAGDRDRHRPDDPPHRHRRVARTVEIQPRPPALGRGGRRAA